MNIFAILEGLISSVPEAIALYHKVVPLLSPNADISDAQIAEVTALAPEVHAAVDIAHAAIAQLIDSHAPVTAP
jgi:hypothetical protein